MSRPRAKLGPIDWLFLVGGPVLFLAIAWFGIRSLLGPPPPPNPIAAIREGRVRPGMTEEEVRAAVGAPRVAFDREDGGRVLRYTQSRWDTDRKVFLEEDADVQIGADGFVSSIGFSSSTPPPPSAP